jgi:hypothetical protein
MADFMQSGNFSQLYSLCEENAALVIANCGKTNQYGEPWVENYQRKDLGLTVYYSKEKDSSLTRFLGVCRFPATDAAELMAYLHDLPKRLTWDTNCSDLQAHMLYTWPSSQSPTSSAPVCPTPGSSGVSSTDQSDRIVVLCCTTKAVGPISARDFVDVNYVKHIYAPCVENASGASASSATGAAGATTTDCAAPRSRLAAVVSAGGHTAGLAKLCLEQYSSIFPPTNSSVVRGVTSGGCGWYIVQEPGGDCIMHYIIHCDLKGWFPAFVVNNTLGGTFAEFFAALKKSREKV